MLWRKSPSRRFKKCAAKASRGRRLIGGANRSRLDEVQAVATECLEDRLLLSAAPVIASLSAGGSENKRTRWRVIVDGRHVERFEQRFRRQFHQSG